MIRDKVVLWGTSGHSKVITDIIKSTDRYEVHGYLDDINVHKHGTYFEGGLILGGREQLTDLLDLGITNIILAFGDCEARQNLSHQVRQLGFNLVTAIHPSAIVSKSASIGEGCMVCANAVINSNSVIEDNVIVNTGSIIEHDCYIGESSHLSSRVVIGGGVRIGSASWIGIGSVIRDKIIIGERSVIGAGAVVVSNIPDLVIAYGVPAKIVRQR